MTQQVTSEDRKQGILKLLRDQNVSTVVLLGEAGVGKTWMAREVSKFAVQMDLCFATLWIYPEYLRKGRSLAKIISFQLSASPPAIVEKIGQRARIRYTDITTPTVKKSVLKKLEEVKSAKIGKMTTSTPEKLHLLVVLDDIHEKRKDEILANLFEFLPKEQLDYKVLVTRRSNSDGGYKMNDEIQTRIDEIPLEFLTEDTTSNLLKNIVKAEVSNARGFGRLSTAIVRGSLGHPGAIIMVAKALDHIENLKLETAIEEAASFIESSNSTPDQENLDRLMQYVYEMLPSITISNCAWYCRYWFQQHGSIHFNELITYWIMEGYFGHHDHIEEAYHEAHLALIELVDRGILRVKEDNHVSMESDAVGLADYRRRGLSGSTCLGLPNVLDGANWEGLGRVTQTQGIIKGSHWTTKEISSLLIDGTHLCKGVLQTFFEPLKKLKVLVILNPTFKEVPEIFSELMELQVLVLRACTWLQKVDVIKELTRLVVLEISGACLLSELDDGLFKKMVNLRSINLSEAGIESLPSSLLDQVELRWLILRGCLDLKVGPNLKFPKKLEVIDLSGSSLKTDKGRVIRDLKNLQTLDISRTQIGCIPFLVNLPNLSRLLLSECERVTELQTLAKLKSLQILDCSKSKGLKKFQDKLLKVKFLDLSDCHMQKLPPNISRQSHMLLSGCLELHKLPSTKALEYLEVLDLSDASSFVKFIDDSFEHLKSLRQLNLSNTKIEKLPSLSHLTELRQLLLKNCKGLEDLLGLSTLAKLEVLDLSGCSKLVIKEDESFKSMSHLKVLNLSHTKVTSLQLDCFPKNLCQLIIRGCTDLKVLPSLESLYDIEVLDLFGLKSLSAKETRCIKNMTKLRRLNLSGVIVDELLSLANLTNLTELSLKTCFCKEREEKASREPKLLNLSGRKDVSLLPLESFSNLQKLSLGGFADWGDLNLKSLKHLEDLDLSEMKREDYPYEISELTGIRKLHLQVNKKITEIDWKRIKYLPEDFKLDCCGSQSTKDKFVLIDCSQDSLFDDFPSISIVIFGTGFFQFLDKENNPQLWDKCFKKFHFTIWLPRMEDGKQKDERAYYLGERALLRDIESQKRVPNHKDLKRYLEIHGSYDLLSPHKNVLACADHLSLIDDSSIDDIFMIGVDILKSKKSFWLERCEKIHCVMDEEKEDIALKKLQYLYLHNLSSLKYIYSDNLQPQVFMALKSLFVEYCPKLRKIFHLLPENLETLEIKFCDGMDMLFHPKEDAVYKLQYLHLMGLPNLKTIGIVLPFLKKLKVGECRKLSSNIVVPHDCNVVNDCPNLQIDFLLEG